MAELLKDKDFLFGLVAFIVGVICLIKVIYERKTSVRLPGVVASNTRDGNGNYYPVVTFTYNGQEYNIEGANGSNKPKYTEGQQVEVFYRPSNQKYVNIVGSNLDIIVGAGLTICGLIITIINIMQ